MSSSTFSSVSDIYTITCHSSTCFFPIVENRCGRAADLLPKMAGAGTFPGAMAQGGEGGGLRRPERRETGQLPRLSSLASGGLEFTGAILAGLFAGHWLDRRWGTGPWLVVVGVFVGAGAGFFGLYRSLTGRPKPPGPR